MVGATPAQIANSVYLDLTFSVTRVKIKIHRLWPFFFWVSWQLRCGSHACRVEHGRRGRLHN